MGFFFFPSECFCEKTERKIVCGSSEEEKFFNCENICEKVLSCQNHKCKSLCHPGDCQTCERDINNNHCACGKTIANNSSRKSCIDPLPTCDLICEKELGCGKNGKKIIFSHNIFINKKKTDERHTCQLKCHDGDCEQCQGESLLKCQCGYIEKTLSCVEFGLESKYIIIFVFIQNFFDDVYKYLKIIIFLYSFYLKR